MAHLIPPTIDTEAIVQLQSPRGPVLEMSDAQLPESVRADLAENTGAGDTRAAIAMARLTGLNTTIRRTTQTTVKAADIFRK